VSRFCSSHSAIGQSSRQTFILHRDILHSLLLPILQIQSQATTFATQALSRQWHSRRCRYPSSPGSPSLVVDLEVAFRGDARGAFSWLQCFMAEEREWSRTEGCPACVALKILHSEPFIRIVVASCRLSSHLRKTTRPKEDGQALRSSSSFPDFDFWETAVRRAVADDDFWGLHFWEDIEGRAQGLETGIRNLIRQGCEISAMSPKALLSQQARAVTFGVPPAKPSIREECHVTAQPRPQQEEQAWMRKIVEACWLALVQEATCKRRTNHDPTIPPVFSRARNLTT
jgi:hypothetical protein